MERRQDYQRTRRDQRKWWVPRASSELHLSHDVHYITGSTELVAEAFSDEGGEVIYLCTCPDPPRLHSAVSSYIFPLGPIEKAKDGGALATRVKPVFTLTYGALEKANKDDHENMHIW